MMRRKKGQPGQIAPQLTPELRRLYRKHNKYLTLEQRKLWTLAMQRRMPQKAIARRMKKSQPWVSYTLRKIIWAVEEGVPTRLYRRAARQRLKLTKSQIDRRWGRVNRELLKMVKGRFVDSRTTTDIAHEQDLPQPEVQALTSFVHRIITTPRSRK